MYGAREANRHQYYDTYKTHFIDAEENQTCNRELQYFDECYHDSMQVHIKSCEKGRD